MRTILLIDDVYTTGATVQEAARIIKKHHDLCIDVLTLARTEHGNGHNRTDHL